jgi:hypothetical protein
VLIWKQLQANHETNLAVIVRISDGWRSFVNQIKSKLTLTWPTTYQIKVPGHLGERWSELSDGMMLSFDNLKDGTPITTLTGTLDQAALHGLLSKLYAMGLPLMSIIWMEAG